MLLTLPFALCLELLRFGADEWQPKVSHQGSFSGMAAHIAVCAW